VQIREVIPRPANMLFILIGAALVVIIYLFGAVVSIPPGKVGVVFRKIGDDPAVKDRFIVEKGEKGIQREVLMPGWRFFWQTDRLWKIDISKSPYRINSSTF
jgi:regulator of protease activity HflC (stomatin/prohibitin superfamily)